MNDTPQTPYQILGEQGIRELSSVFYDIMDSLPEAATLRAMHAEDLAPMKEKLAEYLIEKAGVALVPGPAFGLGGHVRISIATSMDNLQNALDRIERVIG